MEARLGRSTARATAWFALCLVLALACRGRCAAAGEGTGVIRGVVVDAAGRPVAGARVAAQSHDETRWSLLETRDSLAGRFAPRRPVVVDARTGADGRYRLAGLRSNTTYELSVMPPAPHAGRGRTALARAAAIPETRFELGAGRAIRGRLVDARGRGLVGSLIVYAQPRVTTWGSVPLAAALLVDQPTDAEGGFELRVPVDSVLRIEACVPGVGCATHSVVGGAQDADELVRLREPDGAVAHGRVLDPAGAPVVGARVLVYVTYGPSRSWIRRTVGLARSGADGAWRVEGLPEGTLTRVAATAPGRLVFNATNLGIPLRRDRPWATDLPLAAAGRLAGRVLAEDGAPVAGATVTALVDGLSSAPRGYPQAVTDAEGRYAFDELPLEPGGLRIAAPGHLLPWDDTVTTIGGWPAVPFDLGGPSSRLTLDATLVRGRALQGQIVAPDGSPVPGADVRVRVSEHARGAGRQVHRQAWSGVDGHFTVAGLPTKGHATVSASAPGFAHTSAAAPTTPAGAAPLKLVLRRPAIVRGRVLDTSGRPVPRINVGLEHWQARATTAADGSFSLESATGGSLRIGAGPYGAPVVTAVVEVAAGAVREGLVLRWPGTEPVEGRVVDGAGQAVAGVRVTARASTRRASTAMAYTDPAGRFRITHVPPGRYGLFVEDQQEAAGEVEPGGHAALVYDPAPVQFFDATVVTHDGKPVPRATVRIAFGTDGVQISRGFAYAIGGRLRLVRPAGSEGALALTVTDPRDALGRPLNALPTRVVIEDPGAAPITLRLERAVMVAGRVVDDEGQGIDGLRLLLNEPQVPGEPYRPARVAWTRRGGYYRFVGTRPVEMTITVPQSMPWIPVKPRPVGGGQKNVVITLQRWQAIGGRVLDPTGEPAPGSQLRLWWPTPGTTRGNSMNTVAGEDGAFLFPRVWPGRSYTLRVDPPRREVATEVPTVLAGLRAGATDLALRLPRGLTIEGTVTDRAGKAIEGCVIEAVKVWPEGEATLLWKHRRKTRSGADGRYALGVFERGALTNLAFSMPPGAEITYFGTSLESIPAGAPDVHVRLPQGHVLRGVVEGVDAKLLGGLRLSAMPQANKRPSSKDPACVLDGKTNAFRIGPLRAGSYRIAARHRTRRGSPRSYFVPADIEVVVPSKEPLVITVVPAHELVGRLAVADTHGFVVEFHEAHGAVKRIRRFEKDGSFRHGPLRDAPGTFLVYKPGDARVLLLEQAQPSAGPFVLEPGAGRTISGRILGLPEKVSRGRVVARLGTLRLEGAIAEDGWWETAALPPGAWTLEFTVRKPTGGAFVVPEGLQPGARGVIVEWQAR